MGRIQDSVASLPALRHPHLFPTLLIMSTQSNLRLESKKSGPVECLGHTFPSDDARREHYLALLAEKLGADILLLCVEVGGCLSGEHGVGIEKRDLMTAQFTPGELDIQRSIKTAFDADWLLNPAKVFPLEGNPAFA